MLSAFRRIALALVVAGFVPGAGAQTALPAGVQKVAEVEGVTEYRLANGLQVLLYPDPTKPTATVNITFRVGSVHENYGETGMAHLLEHLIFKGSKKYPQPDKEFTARGFRNNGTTWLDRTNYFSTFPATDDNLRWAIDWSADAMVNSFIAQKDLDSEMTVVRNEFELWENQPGNVLFKRVQAAAYDWHNYGKSSVGTRSDIENVRIENLQAFYRKYYQPDNATLIVAGKFDAAKTLGWIVESFGAIPKPARTLPVFYTEEPTQDGERSVIVRRKGDLQLVVVAYRIPAGLSDQAAPLLLASEVLADTPNGRLHKALVEPGLAAQVFAQPLFTRYPGLLIFGAVVKKGEPIEPARDKLIEVIEGSLAAQPPTDAEMTRVKQDVEAYFERTLADPQRFGVTLSESIALGDWRLFFVRRDRVAQVSSAQVAAAAGSYLRRDNRTVGIFLPEDNPQRAEIPSPLAAADLLKDFKPRTAVAAGEAWDPSQANIDARTQRAAIADLKLALLPKKTRGETVDVAVRLHWGDDRSLFGKSVIADLTEAMISRGTSRLTRQQIADEMTRLKMTGSVTQFQTTRENLAASLKLAAHVLREANFPGDEFAQLQRQIVTGLQAQMSDPGALSRDALARHFDVYPAGDRRAYLPLAARIDAVQKATVEDVKAFHRDFWGTARGEVAIVGDFDAAAAEALIREQFAGWSSTAPYAPLVREPADVAPQRIFIDTPDKENAFYRARLNLALRDDDPDYPALVLADFIFGGGSGLSNRLIERVRQRDGISYGAGSGLAVGSRDRAAYWSLGGIMAPQNAQRFEQAAREEIERMLRDGFTDQEIADAKSGLLQQREQNRSQDGQLAQAWAGYLEFDRTFAFSSQFEDRVRALSAADVLAAVRKHIDPAKLTVVIAGDAKKGAK